MARNNAFHHHEQQSMDRGVQSLLREKGEEELMSHRAVFRPAAEEL
jgi:hypothetical protein